MKPTKENIFVLISISAIFTPVITRRFERTACIDTCGVPKIRSGLIINGQNFTRGQFPWIVALMNIKISPPSYFCGGTLISSNFVISAAHCFLPKDSTDELLARYVRALFGAHVLDDCLEPGRYALSPKKVTIHSDWNPGTESYDADISLLEFEEGSIHFNSYIQPICPWHSENGTTETKGTVIGWGKSEDPSKKHENEPKIIQVLIQSNEECLPGEKELAGMASRKTFCAGHKDGSGICHGDSGGGLSIKINNVHHLKGIVSSSLLNGIECDVSKNAIYTNVPKFRPWIEKLTATAKIVFCSETENITLANNQTIKIQETCNDTEFNCCPDGVTPAKNVHGMGCPEELNTTAGTTTTNQKKSNSYVCNQPLDTGDCDDYEIYFTYDSSEGRCKRFYYSGCGGNGNKFETKDECDSACTSGGAQSVAVTANILLPKGRAYSIGSDISLYCNVTGEPKPHVTWYKDKKPLQVSNHVENPEANRIIVVEAQPFDSGSYQCVARNYRDQAIATEVINVENFLIPYDCTDNENFPRCIAVVKGHYCNQIPYRTLCCKSCTLAGQLPAHT